MFTNSSDELIETEVSLKGNLELQEWNPHTGEIRKNVSSEIVVKDGQEFTKFALKLKPVKSLFILRLN